MALPDKGQLSDPQNTNATQQALLEAQRDAINKEQWSGTWGGTSTGAANTYAITMDAPPSAYVEGMRFLFKAHQAPAGACTLQVGTGPAVALLLEGAALAGGEFAVNDYVPVRYDGTAFQIARALPDGVPREVIIDNGVSPGTITLPYGAVNFKVKRAPSGSNAHDFGKIIAPANMLPGTEITLLDEGSSTAITANHNEGGTGNVFWRSGLPLALTTTARARLVYDGANFYEPARSSELLRGTFTPELGDGLSAITYVKQIGYWEKSGRRVFVMWDVEGTNVTVSAGTLGLRLKSLPFVVDAGAGSVVPVGNFQMTRLDLPRNSATDVASWQGYVEGSDGTTEARLYIGMRNAVQQDIQAQYLGNVTDVTFRGTLNYLTTN